MTHAPAHCKRRAKDGKYYTQAQFEEKFGDFALLTEWSSLPVGDATHDIVENVECNIGKSNRHMTRREYYRKMFEHLDVSRDGQLDIEEMRDLLSQGRRTRLSERELRQLFAGVDLNGNGLVDFDEFYEFLHDDEAMVQLQNKAERTRSHRNDDTARRTERASRSQGNAPLDQMRRRFQELDVTRDGKLDFREMKALLRQGDPRISDNDCRRIFRSADQNANGVIDFDEFCDFLYNERPSGASASPSRGSTREARPVPGGGTKLSTDVMYAVSVSARSNEFAGKADQLERNIRGRFPSNMMKLAGWMLDNPRQPVLVLTLMYYEQHEKERLKNEIVDCIQRCAGGWQVHGVSDVDSQDYGEQATPRAYREDESHRRSRHRDESPSYGLGETRDFGQTGGHSRNSRRHRDPDPDELPPAGIPSGFR